MTTCDRCGAPFDTRRVGTWHQVTGWVVDRASQGLSANSVHEKEFTGRVRCPDCGRLARLGVSQGQGELPW